MQQVWPIAGVSVAVLLLVLLGAHRETVFYLTGIWNQLEMGEYAHGYLVLAISVYLMVRDRRALADLTPCPNYWALLAVVAAGLLWTAAALADVLTVQAVGLLFLMLSIVWTVLGNQVTGKLLFPILFIGFALPIWFPLSPVLQDLTANVVFEIARALRIPAFREENLIVLPAGTLSIEEACSGLRYLLAALTLGTLYAYLNYTTLRGRLVVVLIAAGAAVLTNMLRVFIVVYLAYATDMQHPLIRHHLTLGWYLFGGMVVLLLVIDALVHRHHQPAVAGKPAGGNAARPAGDEKGKLQEMLFLGVGVVLVSAGPAAVHWVSHQPSNEIRVTELDLPAGKGGWTGPIASDDDWTPEFHGAITRKQAYQKNGTEVYLYVGYYPAQQQDKELINDLNQISNNGFWHTRYTRSQLQDAGDIPVLEQLLEKAGGGERLVWYWYRVAGRQTTNKYTAKALQVFGLVTGQPQASVTAAAVDTHADISRARQVLAEFISTMQGSLANVGEGNANQH
ncbi:MAG: EpsI family protein [Gammaproteobacteria bacterium]|nr:EpsI family protein [Gammaproteobacteria bacterium]